MKELNKVISHKGFRIALVALLAVIMVTAFVVERTNLTRAGDEAAEPVVQDSTLAEAPAPAPDPEPAPVEPTEPSVPAVEPEATAAPAAEATVAPTVAPAAEATVAPAAEATPVAETVEPTEEVAAEETEEAVGFANAEEDKDFRTGYAYTLGSVAVYNDRKETHEFATLPEGAVVRVTKRVEKERDGEVVETWMGVRFMAQENDEGDLAQVDGYVPAWSLMQLDEDTYLKRVALYERSLLEDADAEALAAEEAGEDIGEPIETSEGTPVVRVPFAPLPAPEKNEAAPEETAAPDEAAAPEAAEEAKPAPRVEVSFEHEGEMVEGTTITLHAKLINMPEDREIKLQWKNNASGEFEAVPGATNDSYAFQVNADNVDWKWVMEVRIGSGA